MRIIDNNVLCVTGNNSKLSSNLQTNQLTKASEKKPASKRATEMKLLLIQELTNFLKPLLKYSLLTQHAQLLEGTFCSQNTLWILRKGYQMQSIAIMAR